MAPRKSYSRPRNRVQLDLDPFTLDRLEAVAVVRKIDKDRAAYELLQRALGIAPPPSLPINVPADEEGRKIDFSNYQAFKPLKDQD